MTCVLPLSARRCSTGKNSSPSPAVRHTSTSASLPGTMDEMR